MTDKLKPTPVVINHADGGFHYGGNKHYPRPLEDQKRGGLVAPDGASRSITGRLVKTNTPAA